MIVMKTVSSLCNVRKFTAAGFAAFEAEGNCTFNFRVGSYPGRSRNSFRKKVQSAIANKLRLLKLSLEDRKKNCRGRSYKNAVQSFAENSKSSNAQ